jgi:hypothetical protein
MICVNEVEAMMTAESMCQYLGFCYYRVHYLQPDHGAMEECGRMPASNQSRQEKTLS